VLLFSCATTLQVFVDAIRDSDPESAEEVQVRCAANVLTTHAGLGFPPARE
jgi:hypothetical protein